MIINANYCKSEIQRVGASFAPVFLSASSTLYVHIKDDAFVLMSLQVCCVPRTDTDIDHVPLAIPETLTCDVLLFCARVRLLGAGRGTPSS